MLEPRAIALAAEGLAVVLALVTVAAWAAPRPDGRLSLLLALAGLAGGAAWALDGRFAPDSWIGVLQEGLTYSHIAQLYGQAAHAEPGYHGLRLLVVPERAGDGLRALVRLNTGLMGACLVLYFVIARHIVRWPAALALTVTLALSPASIHAALSEMPTAMWNVIFLLGVAVSAAIQDEESPSALRRLGLAALGALALAGALVRVETLAISLAAFVLALAGHTLGVARVEALWVRARELVVRALSVRPEVVAIALFALMLGFGALGLPLVDLYDPLGLGALVFFPMMTSMVPLGPALLTFGGLVRGLREPRLLALPLTVLFLTKVYYSQAHSSASPYEFLRYFSMLVVPAMTLALFGWRQIAEIVRRLGGSERAVRATRTLIAISFLSLDVIGMGTYQPLAQDNVETYLGGLAPTVTRDQQLEVRYLLSALERHRECQFLARVVPGGHVSTNRFGLNPVERWDLVRFGGETTRPEPIELGGRSVLQAARQEIPGCVLYYRGLDCSLLNERGECDADVAGLTPIEEVELPALRFYTHVRPGPSMRLALYRLDG